MERIIKNLEVVEAIQKERELKTQMARYEKIIHPLEDEEVMEFVNTSNTFKDAMGDYSIDKTVTFRESVQNSIGANCKNYWVKGFRYATKRNLIIADDGHGMIKKIFLNNFFGIRNRSKTNYYGGFGMGSISVMGGKVNYVVTRGSEGTYVGVFMQEFVTNPTEDNYPIIVGPFNCSIKDVFVDAMVSTTYLPDGNGTVVFMEDTELLKRNRTRVVKNLDIKNILLKLTLAGDHNYLLDNVPATYEFPKFHISVEENDSEEVFYGYMRLVNYEFVENYNHKYGTNWDLDHNIPTKREAVRFYNEIMSRQGEYFRYVVEKLYPQDPENFDSLIAIFGDGCNVLPMPVPGSAKEEHIERLDFRGLYVGNKGLEVKKLGDKYIFNGLNGMTSTRIVDLAYCILTHENAQLSSNRENLRRVDEYEQFESVGMSKLVQVLNNNADFLHNIQRIRTEMSSERNKEQLAKAIEDFEEEISISINTSNPMHKRWWDRKKCSTCEKTTYEIYSWLESKFFEAGGEDVILPTLLGHLRHKGTSYDALVSPLKVDSYVDRIATMEFEFDLKSFNHPLDNINYIACYSHDGIKVGEEFTLNNGRVPARIIEKNGRKYIKTDAADWNIGLFVMKDFLDNFDSYLDMLN